ncbi:MAG: cupin-like domain-containing protein [Synechococcus sp.]
MPELSLSPVPRLESITREEFEKKYLTPKRPVIVQDIAAQWVAIQKWTPEFLKSKYGDKFVKVYDSSFVKAGKSYMSNVEKIPFDSFLDSVLNDDRDLRMFLYNICREIPELVDDIQLPSLVDGLSKNFIFMFFGCRGSATQMHFDIDMAHVFHTVFYGRKVVTLYPYEQGCNIYRYPFTCRSYIDVHKPDFDRYPKLKAAQGYRVEIEPGETLFMPSGYWHHMVYEEPGYSLSLRWAPQSLGLKLRGYYNIFVMSVIDRLMNKISPEIWFNWKTERARV